MQTLHLDNGDTLPQLGLGTWKSRPDDVYAAVKEAIRVGYRHIDCAWAYDNEAEVGRALADAMAGGVRRDELWVTSKLWNSFHHRDIVKTALKATLHNLQLEYLDLYLMHWPVALREGVGFPKTAADMIPLDELPVIETWRGMEDSVDAGLTRHIGVSNFSAAKLERLLGEAHIKPAMEQVELHPYLQQQDLLDFCRGHGILVTAYSPLGSGDRSKAMKVADEPVLLDDPVITRIARHHTTGPAQILIAWALARSTAVIPKSVRPEHIQANLAAADLKLDDAEMREIAQLDRHRRYLDGKIWTLPGSSYTLANLWDE